MNKRSEAGALPLRFERIRTLGKGALGEVELVRDRELGAEVALKRLPRPDPRMVAALKHEFRLARELAHPNLIQLYELFVDEEHCFFTMKAIQGGPFTVGLRHALDAHDGPYVRSLVAQLIDAVSTLHDARIVHRDIKPWNILVDASTQCVTLLDLDLAWSTQLGPTPTRSGTPKYMAPEAMWGLADERSDWFSVGATLHEAVWGVPPFDAPSSTTGGAPAWLASLIDSLLCERPEDRPDSRTLRSDLGLAIPAPVVRLPLLGRQRELDIFDTALDQLLDGSRPAALWVTGASGSGKSRLLDEFEVRASQWPNTLVVRARCAHAEDLPFKALDSLMSSLAHLLAVRAREPGWNWDPPPSWWPAGELFPDLLRVLVSPPLEAPVRLPEARRRQAVVALRELLRWLRSRVSLVWMLDDAQWGDQESAGLLGQLSGGGDQPPMLMVVAGRSEPSVGPFVDVWRQGQDIVPIEMSPLADQIVIDALRTHGALTEARARQVAAQCHGSPFLMYETVRSAHMERVPETIDVVGQRLTGLSEVAYRLALLLALAQVPIPRSAALHALGPDVDAVSAFQQLDRLRLMHVIPVDGTVATGHARFRDRLLADAKAGEVRAGHERLAEALWPMREIVGAEPLLSHLQAAERNADAVTLALDSADNARVSLRFEEQAAYLMTAAPLASSSEQWGLWERAGDAWRTAGDGPRASAAYLRALEAARAHASPRDQRRMSLKAGEELIRHGERRRGTSLIGEALRGVGVRIPRSATGAWLMGATRRLPVYARGFGVRPRAQPLPPDQDELLTALWMATHALTQADVAMSFALSGQLLAASMRYRDPIRMVGALGTEAAIHASIGSASSNRRADAMLERVDVLTDQVEGDWALSRLAFRGVVSWHRGQWADTVSACTAAVDELHRHPERFAWELATMQQYLYSARFFRGEIDGLYEAVLEAQEAAVDRGDHHVAVGLGLGEPGLVHLLNDNADAAHAALAQAMHNGFEPGPDLATYYYTVLEGHLALYEGRPTDALRIVQERWPLLEQGGVTGVQNARVWLTYLQALATARAEPPGALRALRRCTRILQRCTPRHAAGLARNVQALWHEARGDRISARDARNEARSRLLHADTRLLAEAQDRAPWLAATVG